MSNGQNMVMVPFIMVLLLGDHDPNAGRKGPRHRITAFMLVSQTCQVAQGTQLEVSYMPVLRGNWCQLLGIGIDMY